MTVQLKRSLEQKLRILIEEAKLYPYDQTDMKTVMESWGGC